MTSEFVTNSFFGLVFVLPVFMCNAFAGFMGALFKKLGKIYPMDGGRKWKDGNPLLGDHKTWPGFIGGLIAGTITGIILWHYNNLNSFFLCSYPWYIGILMGVGDHFADLMGSFIKRRMGKKSGASLPLYDQGSWMVTGALIALPFCKPIVWIYYIVPIVLTPLIHVIAGFIALWTGIKDVWY
ncbi:MAG: CDP-archaeol synthase [Candidatus Heimdallarchaeum endolithica]|uniref:CDP-archaeol synthase n=1 Tax=Candidatus Heimdallarchaeum endolithica TaxID=2876572 RepID=A0A9Y1BS84_9ARCH|nr:MAG: CDP-archaeol synthase [Candidatus Heimdallarchaeum endolithica]